MEHEQIEWSLYFAFHGVSQTSTSSLCLKKGIWWGFGHEWNGTLEPFTMIEGNRTNSYTKKIYNYINIHH
jgi:hypothetical protein